MNDEEYMKIALDLAKKGCGFVNPNPIVGAMMVKLQLTLVNQSGLQEKKLE